MADKSSTYALNDAPCASKTNRLNKNTFKILNKKIIIPQIYSNYYFRVFIIFNYYFLKLK